MSPGHDGRLYFLAFDHRAAFARAVFNTEEINTEEIPTRERERTLSRAKLLIFAGVGKAIRDGRMLAAEAGILVDERYGAAVAREARRTGVRLAMPVEEPDQELFTFAYGEAFREHINGFQPDFAKVLVRYNVEGDNEGNLVQAGRLAELSEWLRSIGRGFLFELLVEPTDRQLQSVGGDRERFEHQRRPELIYRAMEQLQVAGVEPDVWKLEGIDEPADAERVVAQARSGAERQGVGCVVLGAGASAERVEHWLRVAATVDGYAGFAIGRSIWRDPVRSFLAGTIAASDAETQIADLYVRCVELFKQHSDGKPPVAA